MSSRARILEKIKQNQSAQVSDLPSLTFLGLDAFDILEKYKTTLRSIGGDFVEVKNYNAIIDFVKQNYLLNVGKLIFIIFHNGVAK